MHKEMRLHFNMRPNWTECSFCDGAIMDAASKTCIVHTPLAVRRAKLRELDGHIDAQGVSIDDPDIISDLVGSLRASNAAAKDLKLDYAEIQCEFDLRDLRELGAISAYGATFTSSFNTAGVHFKADSDFRRAIFLGSASFQNSHFWGRARFERMVVISGDFSRARFHKSAHFNYCVFIGATDFSGSSALWISHQSATVIGAIDLNDTDYKNQRHRRIRALSIPATPFNPDHFPEMLPMRRIEG